MRWGALIVKAAPVKTCPYPHPLTLPQAIDPNGREVALRRGANVLMPILTPTK